MTPVFGIDGCAGGWIVAAGNDAGGDVEFALAARFSEVLEILDSGLAVVDIPIGLAGAGPRTCDVLARRLLGFPRAGSVFSPPVRSALWAGSYVEACARNEAACGRRLSRQSYGIMAKIREVDAIMTPDRQRNIREGHPEIVFARLQDEGRGLVASKKTPHGRSQRRGLLRRELGRINVAKERRRIGKSVVAADDLIDAAACLLASRWIVEGCATILPSEPEIDARGLRMEIVG